MGFRQVVFQRYPRMAFGRIAHHLCRDERVAVAVAAYPAAHAQERLYIEGLAVIFFQVFFQAGIQLRDFGEEGVAIKGQAVFYFIFHFQLGIAQHARIPQDQHKAVQRFLVDRQFFRRHV